MRFLYKAFTPSSFLLFFSNCLTWCILYIFFVLSRYDVLLSPHIASLKEHMYAAQLNKPVTFAAERDCWPDPALCKWLTTAPYLNAGVFAGEKLHVRAMLEDMVLRLGEFGFCGEDQRAYQR